MNEPTLYHPVDRHFRVCLHSLCRGGLLGLTILGAMLLPGCVPPSALNVKQLERRENVAWLATLASRRMGGGYLVSEKRAAAAEAAMFRVLRQWADGEGGACREMLDNCAEYQRCMLSGAATFGLSEKEKRFRREFYDRCIEEYARRLAANGRPALLGQLLEAAKQRRDPLVYEMLERPVRVRFPEAVAEAEKRGRDRELLDAWYTYHVPSAKSSAVHVLTTKISEAEKQGREKEIIDAWFIYHEPLIRSAAMRVLTTKIRTRKICSLTLSIVKYRWESSVKATLQGAWLDERWVEASQQDNIRDERYDALVRALQQADLWTADPNGLHVVAAITQYPAHKEYGDRGYDSTGVRQIGVTPSGAGVPGVQPTEVPERILRSISTAVDGYKIDLVPGEVLPPSFADIPLN